MILTHTNILIRETSFRQGRVGVVVYSDSLFDRFLIYGSITVRNTVNKVSSWNLTLCGIFETIILTVS